jgi:hypothetical protein
MKNEQAIFDTSSEVTKKKPVLDINGEPEMIELKRMIRAGELDADRVRLSIHSTHGHRNPS